MRGSQPQPRCRQRGRTSIYHLQNYTEAALQHVLREAGFDSICIARQNELSWPVSRYVDTYLCKPYGLPKVFAPLLVPVFYPFLATKLLNPNKALVFAAKR